jgi:hypothetical protein
MDYYLLGINWSDYNNLFWTIKFVKKLTFIVGEFGKCDYNELMKYIFIKLNYV